MRHVVAIGFSYLALGPANTPECFARCVALDTRTDWTDTHIPRTERPVRFHVATSRFVGATHPTRWAYIA